jgi:hypothetical protein
MNCILLKTRHVGFRAAMHQFCDGDATLREKNRSGPLQDHGLEPFQQKARSGFAGMAAKQRTECFRVSKRGGMP